MKFSSFYTGFFVDDVEEKVKEFEKIGFSIKHKTGGHGYSMYILELPKGDRIAVVKAPPEMGKGKMVTMINVDNIEEARDVFTKDYGCQKVGDISEIETTKFQNVSYDGHLITLMEHIKGNKELDMEELQNVTAGFGMRPTKTPKQSNELHGIARALEGYGDINEDP